MRSFWGCKLTVNTKVRVHTSILLHHGPPVLWDPKEVQCWTKLSEVVTSQVEERYHKVKGGDCVHHACITHAWQGSISRPYAHARQRSLQQRLPGPPHWIAHSGSTIQASKSLWLPNVRSAGKGSAPGISLSPANSYSTSVTCCWLRSSDAKWHSAEVLDCVLTRGRSLQSCASAILPSMNSWWQRKLLPYHCHVEIRAVAARFSLLLLAPICPEHGLKHSSSTETVGGT